MEAEVKVILDKRRESKKVPGGYRVAVRVTFDRQPRLYSTGKALTADDFDKVYGTKPRGDFKDLRRYFDALQSKAETIAADLGEDFTFDSFYETFVGGKYNSDKKDVYALFDKLIANLESQERIKTAISYRTAMNALKTYKPKLSWKDVSPTFLKGFESHFVKEGKSLTTVGIYARALRKVVNDAIALGYMPKDKYPFGKNGYVIPKGSNVKKALTKDEVKLILKYKSKNKAEIKARDLWLFSFLCNGMNFADIASLRVENIQGELLVFTRKKTTRSSNQLIRVPLLPEAKKILKTWANVKGKQKDLLFDITNIDATPKQFQKDVDQAVKTTNKYMDRIGSSVGIKVKVTTYYARHSYATILKRSGVSVAQISEALGHSSLLTTQSYLDSFDDDTLIDVQKNLLS